MLAQNKSVIRNERGFVMVVALVLLLVLTIIGVTGITSSTVENMLAGNIRVRAVQLFEADSGIEVSAPLINQVMGVQNNDGFASLIPTSTESVSQLVLELTLSSFNPDCRDDFVFQGNAGDVGVDIDRMYAGKGDGCSLEFASGADSPGRCDTIYYRINSTSTGMVGEEATVGTVYRLVPWW